MDLAKDNYLIGLKAFMNGMYIDALSHLNESIKLEPGYADAYLLRGSIWYFLGEYDDSIEDYNKAIQYNVANHKVYLNRCITLKRLGRFDDAKDDINTFLELVPNDQDGIETRAELSDYYSDEPTERCVFNCPTCGHYKVVYLETEMIVILFNCPNCQSNFNVDVSKLKNNEVGYLQVAKRS